MNITHPLTYCIRPLLSATLIAMSGIAVAQPSGELISSSTYSQAKTQLKAMMKTEVDACASKTGNAKDICKEIAKGEERVAMAHLEVQRTGKASDVNKLRQAQYEARYAVAKERCDDSNGAQKDLCITEAKATRDKAKASATADKEITQAVSDEQSERMKADHKVANEKCDSLSGANKDSCKAAARARFAQ